jgi:hypothetical protein
MTPMPQGTRCPGTGEGIASRTIVGISTGRVEKHCARLAAGSRRARSDDRRLVGQPLVVLQTRIVS